MRKFKLWADFCSVGIVVVVVVVVVVVAVVVVVVVASAAVIAAVVVDDLIGCPKILLEKVLQKNDFLSSGPKFRNFKISEKALFRATLLFGNVYNMVHSNISILSMISTQCKN